MNFDGSFRRIGSASVEYMKGLVSKLSDDSWYQDASEMVATAKGGIQVIYLVHDDQLRHDEPTRRPALEVFGQALRPILAVTADHFDSMPEGQELTQKYGAGYFVRAKFLRLMNESAISVHADTGLSEQCSHRVHVPIISNANVRLTVADETLTLPEGEIYEINNLRTRCLENRGVTACVHLVLDYVLERHLTR